MVCPSYHTGPQYMFFTTKPYSQKQSKNSALYNHEWQPICFLCKMFLTVTLATTQKATDVRILFSQPSYSLLYTVNRNQGYSYCWSIDLLVTLACITQTKQAEERESRRQKQLGIAGFEGRGMGPVLRYKLDKAEKQVLYWDPQKDSCWLIPWFYPSAVYFRLPEH